MIHSILSYLQDACRDRPDKAAFSDARGCLSYRELWQQARDAGYALHQLLDGQQRQPVFVCIGRNTGTIAAFLATAAAGCFYVPIDLSLPQGRLRDLQKTLSPRVVITTDPDQGKPPFEGVTTLTLEELTACPGDPAEMDRIQESILDTDPLYCIFTSGSTGVPKGVLVSHRSVIDMAEQFSTLFPLDGDSVFGNQAPFDFDVSVKDIYLGLKQQARVHILDKKLFSMPVKLIREMNEQKVNTIIWSVSAMKIVSALKTFRTVTPDALRLVMFSGEVMPCRILSEWQEALPGAQFVNLYGPTEITCNCTYYPIRRRFDDGEALPIGKAFPNSEVLLLDGDREIREAGVTGEICVRGTCLALGYYGNAQATADAFCQDPRQQGWPERIYRTGDLGQWNSQGELLFRGRADSQVKCMGFRIELGDIDAAANALDFLDSACCLFDPGREQLWLFYQAQETCDKEILAALKQTLPMFMVPKRLVRLERMPLTRTGKMDRNALRQQYFD